MSALGATRRPRAVFGRRGRGAKQSIRSQHAASESDTESSSSSAQSDVEHISSSKENLPNSASIPQSTKGKGKATQTVAHARKPMQSRPNGAKPKGQSNVICISSDSESEEEDESLDAIRSPQKRINRRRGTTSRPIVIASSASSSTSSDEAETSIQNQDGDLSGITNQLQSLLQIKDTRDTEPLTTLLSVCNQKAPQRFDDCLDEMEKQGNGSKWKKIGEATYSEVFGLANSGMVLKVIPLAYKGDQIEQSDLETSIAESESNIPEQSQLADLQREIEMTRGVSDANEAFVKIHRASIVRGTYSDRLLRAWDQRVKQKSDQNARPDRFEDDQLYGLLLLSDGGKDLESFVLPSWSQAASVFAQVVQAIAEAEQKCEFEHRDLHWGNIVIKEITQGRHGRRDILDIKRILSPKWSGVQATIIDFTLSRACFEENNIIALDMDDEAFFNGKGDIQFEVYRQMRKVTNDDWQQYYPLTNVLWLHYLLRKIMNDKKLKRLAEGADSTSDKIEIGTEATCYELLSTVLKVLDAEEKESRTGTHVKDAASLFDLMTTTLTGSNDSF
ncbi:uncharacterized protein FA14DRAFT_159171 [Meira miltonrushii]|uniref:non-specific serine/threonine protein kinase n=1 Tax=Meira miltonrushii TaxID=1280837 RepID=A0A316VKI3_9BASI|nr:uncharacterized protein FA14DRAFT_159171 [Meira miltonrushii]PWN36843.1 hypothetical protein FA14DRAFT_159171 [Meira miltonrushii]